MLTLRHVIASVFVSVSNLFTCALPALIIVKGAARQVEMPLAVYLGVLIAVALYFVGFAAAARVREALPGAITVLIVGALLQPLASGLSFALRNDNWFLALVFTLMPMALVVGGLRLGKRMLAQSRTDDAT